MSELCKLFETSQTLECVVLEHMRYATPYTFFNPLKCELSDLVDSVLTCLTMKSLTTVNVPFKVRNFDVCCEIQSLTFATTKMGLQMSDENVLDSLFSISSICTLPSMRSLKMGIFSHNNIPIHVIRNFIASLQEKNSLMEKPELRGHIFEQI